MERSERDEDAVGREHRSLASIVRGEAVRADTGDRIRPDPARIAAGWQRRFVIEQGRAGDLVTLYEAQRFEVALDPVAPELVAGECGDCRLLAALEYVQVYTRRVGASAPAGGEAAGS